MVRCWRTPPAPGRCARGWSWSGTRASPAGTSRTRSPPGTRCAWSARTSST